MQKLSQLLIQQRKAKGLKLAQLSEKSKVSIVSLNCYEKGVKIPSLNVLSKIADALDLEYDLLYDIVMNEKNGKKD